MGLLDTQNVNNLVGKLNSGSIKIDAALSETSTNPIQNRVITQALEDLGLDYQYVTLINSTLTEEVSVIQTNLYNGQPFNCIEYYITLEIPSTIEKIELQNLVQRTTGRWQLINVRTTDAFTTTNPQQKTLGFIKYVQNSNVCWYSKSGFSITLASAGGASWNDSYATVPCYPMAGSANSFNIQGISNITLTGLFPVGTKIQMWGKIKQ